MTKTNTKTKTKRLGLHVLRQLSQCLKEERIIIAAALLRWRSCQGLKEERMIIAAAWSRFRLLSARTPCRYGSLVKCIRPGCQFLHSSTQFFDISDGPSLDDHSIPLNEQVETARFMQSSSQNS